MPYKKSYKKYNKKRYSKRSGYYRHGMNAIELAGKSLTVALAVKKLLNVEFKFHDVLLGRTEVLSTPQIIQLTNIPQGDTDISRDGAQVKITDLNIKWTVEMDVTPNFTFLRFMVIHDRQTNGAIYTAGQILEDITTGNAIISPNNLDNKFRFRKLYDKVFTLSNSGGNQVRYGEFNKKLQMKLRFDASTPSIADLTSNSLSIMIISNRTTNGCDLNVFSRVRYVDN